MALGAIALPVGPSAPPGATSRPSCSPRPLVLSVFGGVAGLLIGIAVTVGPSCDRGWDVLIPTQAVWGGLLAVGAVAGAYPAPQGARVQPTYPLQKA